jgi:hypothetical protein
VGVRIGELEGVERRAVNTLEDLVKILKGLPAWQCFKLKHREKEKRICKNTVTLGRRHVLGNQFYVANNPSE